MNLTLLRRAEHRHGITLHSSYICRLQSVISHDRLLVEQVQRNTNFGKLRGHRLHSALRHAAFSSIFERLWKLSKLALLPQLQLAVYQPMEAVSPAV